VELLSYKNFGETSLREIKAILELKSLRLGMVKEEKFTTTEEPDKKISPNEQGLLSKSIEEFQLSVRAKKCLQKLNIRTLGELISKTEAELLGCKNFGVTSLNEIKRMIVNLGLSLRNLS
jgi:DNA-directed RNA polymerase subunit alpha